MMGTMRRHVHWLALLLAVPVSYVVLMLVVVALNGLTADAAPSARPWLALAQLVALVAAVVVPLVLLIRSIVQMRRTYRRAQRAKGKYTRWEQAQLAERTDAAAWWSYARDTRTRLIERRVPESQQQWDVVPYEGERFFAYLPLTYARYYGADVGYTQASTVAVGHPAFVAGVFAISAIANASARSRAAAQSLPQWREWQQVTAYVTNRRIVTFANGRWLSFDYGAIAAVYPDASARALVMQFDSTEPLLLTGPAAPMAAVIAVMQTHGLDAVRDHPGLRALDVQAEQPTLPPVGKRG